MKWVFVLALVALAAANDERVSFDGYKVFRVIPQNLKQLNHLYELRMAEKYDFWVEPSRVGGFVDIMVSPTQVKEFRNEMISLNLPVLNTIHDVEKLAKEQKVAPRGRAMDWTSYHTMADIYDWMDSLAQQYSNLVKVETVGRTANGNDIKIMTISSGGSGKNAIWVDAGIHAREWITPATVTYFINELVVNNAANSQYTDSLDWYFMPIHNPDGYDYSHTNNRMWRKNRMRHHGSCYGVDLNRNFEHHWNEVGASDNHCSDIFAGPIYFSEQESMAVRDFVNARASNIKSFLTFHSYSQLWMCPWGYTTALPSDYTYLMDIAGRATDALYDFYGTDYEIGTSTNVIYAAAGGSDDWAKGDAGIAVSYTVELRDKGWYGFLLPASQIIPTGEETWAGVKVVAEEFM